MKVDWQETQSFKSFRITDEKYCEDCSMAFGTIREGIKHIVDNHTLLNEKVFGPFTLQKVAKMPLGPRDRTLNYEVILFFNDEAIYSGYGVEYFAQGAIWHWELSNDPTLAGQEN